MSEGIGGAADGWLVPVLVLPTWLGPGASRCEGEIAAGLLGLYGAKPLTNLQSHLHIGQVVLDSIHREVHASQKACWHGSTLIGWSTENA